MANIMNIEIRFVCVLEYADHIFSLYKYGNQSCLFKFIKPKRCL